MNLNLVGQQVVVFGAAGGIGRAIAAAFAEEGCRVVGFDLAEPELGEGAEDIEWIVGDVVNQKDLSQVEATMSDVDHVVFAAGAGSGVAGSPFWKIDPLDWSRVIKINLLGAVNVAHAFGPPMAQRKKGTFTFLVSVAGQIGSPTDPPYSAAKAALINFMQVTARDLAPFGIRSNAISPGMVKTDLNRSVWLASQESLPFGERQSYEHWAQEKIHRVSPMGRWQTVDEVAAMSVFLASDHARNITGQTINIDGGQVMHA